MLRAGQILQIVVVALLALAVVMVQSAGMTIGGKPFTPADLFLNRTTIYAALAVAALLLADKISIRRVTRLYGWYNPVAWTLAVSLLLVLAATIPHIGVTINGAHRWLRLGPASLGLTFQPSEIVKWVMVFAIALWCARRPDRIPSFRDGLLPPLLLVAVACVLIVKEDLGTAALVGSVAAILLLAAGAKIWHLALSLPPAAVGLIIAVASSPYRLSRLTSFLNPWADPRGAGYQAIQSLAAITAGGPAGRGLGNGIQKFGYLPADTTDFIYAVICEELGLVGAILVVTLYLTLLWFGLKIVKQSKDAFSKLVALGVILTVGIQAMTNIAVVTVVVPTKGIALPLLSSGGTGWILTAFAIGLVSAIDRDNQPQPAERLTPSTPQPQDQFPSVSLEPQSQIPTPQPLSI